MNPPSQGPHSQELRTESPSKEPGNFGDPLSLGQCPPTGPPQGWLTPRLMALT